MNLVGKLLALAVAIALLAISVDLAVSNPGMVEISLWVADSGILMPVWLLALGSFVAGLVMGGAAMLPPLVRGALERRRLRARVRKLETAADAGSTDGNLRLPGA